MMKKSSSAVFAEPMIDDAKYLDDYWEQVVDLYRKGLLPEMDAEIDYKVYSICGSGFGAHKSIVLTTDDKHFVTVELDFCSVNGRKHIYPRTRQLPDGLEHKLERHGCVTARGWDLIAKAVAVMQQFGSYFKFSNNCQDYCNYYLEAIGLGHTTTLTDVDKGAIVAIFGVIVGAVAIAVKKSNKS